MAMTRRWHAVGSGRWRLLWIAMAIREHWPVFSLAAKESGGNDVLQHASSPQHQPYATRVLPGWSEDFETFFRRFEHELFGYLWRVTHEEQAAYDLSQETFLRAWQHFAKIRAYEQPAGWLFRVATNLALNHLRQRSALHRSAVSLDASKALGGGDVTSSVVEGDAVRRALMTLAPRQRIALVLREVYGFTCQEVAQALGISHGAAKTMLWRAREEFRERYTREESPR